MATPEAEMSMPFWSHLAELRKRITFSLIAVAVGFALCFNYSEDILSLLMWPMNTKIEVHLASPYVTVTPTAIQHKLHFTTLVEPFWTHLKIGLISGIMLAFPVIMYQLWKFISPGLLQRERRYVGYFVFFSSLFFGIGVLFCYLLLLPFAVPFLMTYKTENLTAIIRFGDYIDFILKFLLASGIVFELPLVIVLLSRMGVVTPDWLAKYRKVALLASFVLGAIMTPTPDIFNQLLLSIPIYLLYELGILFARLFGKRKKPETTDLTER